MPFGLTNASSTFQAAMNGLLRPYLRRFVIVFFYGILIYSPNLKEPIVHLQIILEVLHTKKFFAKLTKCSFATSQVIYLGHIISAKGVASDLKKKLFPYTIGLDHVHSRNCGVSSISQDFIESLFITMPLTPLLSLICCITKKLHGVSRLRRPLQN